MSDTPPLATSEASVAEFAKLAHALVHDRRREHRWRMVFRTGWFVLVLIVLGFAFSEQWAHHGSSAVGPHTALVDVRGEIGEGQEASADRLLPALREAFENEHAQAVVVRFNSPGGSPVHAGLVNDEIRRLKALHRKPVYAVVEEVCASGAYYMAVAADEIYVDKASVVGSIGVLMDGFGYTGAMNKLGVERRLYTAGQNKGIHDPFSAEPEAHRAHTQALLDQIHRQFIQVVQDGRGERLKGSPEVFSGLYWNGEQAVKMGLVDHLGSLDRVAREVVKAEAIVDYTPQENVAERLAKHFGASIGGAAARVLGAQWGASLMGSAAAGAAAHAPSVALPRLR
jgi:protease-4